MVQSYKGYFVEDGRFVHDGVFVKLPTKRRAIVNVFDDEVISDMLLLTTKMQLSCKTGLKESD